jgi:two-component system NtrC family sensor kinase
MNGGQPEPAPVPARVLVVEDDPDSRQLLCQILTSAGYTVEAAGDGPAALALVAARPPDLVVLDRVLPGLDGDTLCRMLKADHPAAPVLMLTGAASTGERLAGFAAGADDYIAKPYDVDELLARVAVFDRLRRAETAARRRAAELTTLLALMHQLMAETEPLLVLRRTAEAARELVPSAVASTALVEGDQWRLTAALIAGQWVTPDLAGSVETGVHGWVLRHRRPYRLRTADDPVAIAALAAQFNIQNGLVVPLLDRDGAVLALLGLYDRAGQAEFSTEDERVAVALAAQAALALENARLLAAERARAAEAAAATAALRASQAQLIQAGRLAAVGTLAAGVAHELNQPLMVIRGQTQLLINQAPAPALQRGLERIERQTEHMATIIDHLRTFARPRAGGHVTVSLNDLVGNVLLLCGQQLRDAGITLELALAEPVPLIQGQPGEIEQIILQLLTNAREALAGRDGQIWLSTERRDQTVCLVVRDDGPGMPPAVQERIFEPFFTTKEVGQGVGLGLTIALQAAERYGGTLSVESAPGAGAAFTLALPAAGP